MASGEQTSTVVDGFVDPVDATDGIGLADERAYVGGIVERVSSLELLRAFDEEIGELSVDRVLDENALHRDAGLPGVAETSGDAALGSDSEVGIEWMMTSALPPSSRRTFFARVALDVPTHGAARKTG